MANVIDYYHEILEKIRLAGFAPEQIEVLEDILTFADDIAQEKIQAHIDEYHGGI